MPGLSLTMPFPSDRAVGQLSHYDESSGGWLAFARARGDVTVSADERLTLVLDVRSHSGLGFLDRLPVEPFVRLGLGGHTVYAEDARRVARFCWLTELDLDGCGIDDTDLAALRPLVNLVELRLGGALVTDDGLARIDLPLLRRLDLDFSNVESGLHHLARLPRLEVLDLSGTAVTDLLGLAALPDLHWLSVTASAVRGDGLAVLPSLPSLRELFVGSLPLTAGDVATFVACPGLQVLDCSGADLESPAVVPLSRAGSLRRLRLSGTNVNDVALPWLEPVQTLEALWLDDTEVGDAGLGSVAALPAVRELVLDGTRVTNAGIACLAALPVLRRLDLARTPIDDDAIDALVALPALEELDISGTAVSDAGLVRLAGARRLRSLRLAGTDVTRHGLWDLLHALPDLALPDLGLAPDATAMPSPPPAQPTVESERSPS